MKEKKPIAIIGAGIAGLTAANYLKKNNIPFILFEANDKIAGLAASFRDSEGFTHDFGAHFVTNRLANAIGVGSECRTVKHYGEAIWFGGKSYSYPFGLLKIPRIMLSFAATKIRSFVEKTPSQNASDWFCSRYGTVLASEIALPLIEAWSGAPAEDLSSAVGGSLPSSIIKTFYLKAASFFTGRAVACGYNREMPEMPGVWHVYPKEGVSTLCKKLAEDIEDSIKLQSPVEEVLVENKKVVAVKVKGDIIEVAAVISTAPINILARMVKGSNCLIGAERFKYRPMIFVNLHFQERGLLPDTVLWFPEKKFPFFRLTDVTKSMPWNAPEGKSIITVDIGCQKNDEYWNMDEKKLTDLCLAHLEEIIPKVREKFISSNVLKTPIAYPVFLNEYENVRQHFEGALEIGNLISIGRNGEFAHRFMEDVYWRTLRKVKDLIGSIDLEGEVTDIGQNKFVTQQS